MADPLWRQIAEDLRQKIESGELGADGDPLPTELELRERYKASRNTIRDAIKWLVTRNLVYTRSGQGTFVTPKIEPFVTDLSPESARDERSAFTAAVLDRRREPSFSAPRVEIRRAAGLPAAELKVPENAMVISRHQQFLIDGVPYSRQTTFYPMRLVEQGASQLMQAEDISTGAVQYLRDFLGIVEAGTKDRISVRAPDAEESSFFGIPDDGSTPVFELTRTGYEGSGEPLRVTVTTYPADRNQFVMTSGKVPDKAGPTPQQLTSPADTTEANLRRG